MTVPRINPANAKPKYLFQRAITLRLTIPQCPHALPYNEAMRFSGRGGLRWRCGPRVPFPLAQDRNETACSSTFARRSRNISRVALRYPPKVRVDRSKSPRVDFEGCLATPMQVRH